MANSHFPSGGGSGTPGGSDTQVQFNNAGAFGGFGSWDGTTLAVGEANIMALKHAAVGPDATIDQVLPDGSTSAYELINARSTADMSRDYTYGMFSSFVIDPPGDIQANVYGYSSYNKVPSTNSTAMAGSLAGMQTEQYYYGTGSLAKLYGAASYMELGSGVGSGAVTSAYGMQSYTFLGGATVSAVYGVESVISYDSGAVSDAYHFWGSDLAGVATNPYYEWHDSRGVFRIKEDATFDSVGQAIPALYNPQFTKYTPGAANYERIVMGQWNGNVGEIGIEAGGTGTFRALKLLGNGVSTAAVFQAGGYKSSDGSTGATGSANNTNTLTIKNGLIVAIT